MDDALAKWTIASPHLQGLTQYSRYDGMLLAKPCERTVVVVVATNGVKWGRARGSQRPRRIVRESIVGRTKRRTGGLESINGGVTLEDFASQVNFLRPRHRAITMAVSRTIDTPAHVQSRNSPSLQYSSVAASYVCSIWSLMRSLAPNQKIWSSSASAER